MRSSILILLASLMLVLVWTASAQETGSGAETAARLRSQLSELQDREAGIKIRLQELEYQLKPENIERYFAGVGSVHPEDLREARRKQLQTEKDRLNAQLNEIAQSRTQLEAAISVADVKAHQQSALGSTSLKLHNRLAPFMTATVLRMGAITFGLIVVGLVLFASHKRRQRNRGPRI